MDPMSQGTAVDKVSLMPEYLTVCCWRSAKEASLLLGQLLETTPVVDPSVEVSASEPCGQPLDSTRPRCRKGLVSVSQVNIPQFMFTVCRLLCLQCTVCRLLCLQCTVCRLLCLQCTL